MDAYIISKKSFSKTNCNYQVIGIIILFYFLNYTTLLGQDQKLADSLIHLYQSDSYKGNKLELLEEIAAEDVNLERRLEYANLLISEASNDSLFEMIHSGYLQKGNALNLGGKFHLALESYFESINYATRGNYERGVGLSMIAIANTYSEIGNSTNASTYYEDGIQILREVGDPIPLASALLNAGDEAFNLGDFDLALNYFNESNLLFKDLDYPIGTAYNLGNMGMVYAKQGRNELAENNINKAISILEELEDYYGISVYLAFMSNIYLEKNDLTTAVKYAERSLELATIQGLNNQISEANLLLSEAHEKRNNFAKAHQYYKEHIVYRDSVKNIEVVEQMADQRTNFEVSQKQIEIDLSEQKRKNQRIVVSASIAGLMTIGILALGLHRRNKFIKKTKQIIEEERDRSDSLLLNILPEETATELKRTGKVIAKKYESTTVLFTDFKGFTSYSENLSPEALVETINFYFSEFDKIIEKYGLEKIKTIGDAYMCAGGIHSHIEDHADQMLKAAFEIAAFVDKTKKDRDASKMTFDIRIGINSGPVVAGVVGTTKFAYDIWGDTVNVASRMESMSEPGKINISESTYELVKHNWKCEYRGEIQAKNRGNLKMFFVNEPVSHI